MLKFACHCSDGGSCGLEEVMSSLGGINAFLMGLD
jgi:hypothetical protein